MRRELGKRVRVEFASQIKSRLPQFQLVKGQGLGAGIYLYQWKLAPELSFLLTLQLSTKAWEEFTVQSRHERERPQARRSVAIESRDPDGDSLGRTVRT